MLSFRPSERAEYGLGVVPTGALRGTRVRVGHDGDNVGYRAELRHYPDTGVTIAVLWTDSEVPFRLLENDVAQVVLDHLKDANK